jgi:hypothetical protein
MTFLLGLIMLVTAVAMVFAGAVMHVSDSRGFLFGVETGIVGMLGLALIRGDVGRRTARRRLRRVSDRYRRETAEALRDRDQNARDLCEECAHLPAHLSAPVGSPGRPAGTVTPVTPISGTRPAQATADAPGPLQLRLLQTVVDIAAEKNSTLVMPFPVELLRFSDHACGPDRRSKHASEVLRRRRWNAGSL